MSKYDINKFKHVTVALNTPFDKNGDVDLEATKAVVNYFCSKGIKQMYVCGSTGEGFLLDSEERKAVTETVVKLSLINIYHPAAQAPAFHREGLRTASS